MNSVYLIRHGATAGNLLRRYIGRTDEPLCAEGEAQARALAGMLTAPDRLFVSPMLRTRQTAALAFPGKEPEVIDGLRETDFGDFENRSADEMAEDAAYRAWVEGGCVAPIPGGEDPASARRRTVDAFLRAMDTVPPEKTAAFVFHGGGVMAVLAALAEPPREFYAWRLPNGGFYRCRWENGRLRL